MGETEANLKSAIHGETHEYTDMYPVWQERPEKKGSTRLLTGSKTLAKAEKSTLASSKKH